MKKRESSSRGKAVTCDERETRARGHNQARRARRATVPPEERRKERKKRRGKIDAGCPAAGKKNHTQMFIGIRGTLNKHAGRGRKYTKGGRKCSSNYPSAEEAFVLCAVRKLKKGAYVWAEREEDRDRSTALKTLREGRGASRNSEPEMEKKKTDGVGAANDPIA